jgi:hypothetical protein
MNTLSLANILNAKDFHNQFAKQLISNLSLAHATSCLVSDVPGSGTERVQKG